MEYDLNPEKGICLECGDVIEYGRRGRRFCCDECKNKYHNRQTSNRLTKLRIVSCIDKNYSILEKLVRLNVTSLTVNELHNLGFKFDFVTSYQKVRRHDVFLCYDISFTIMSDMVFDIRKQSINLPVKRI